MKVVIGLLRKLKISNRLMFGYMALFLLILNGANLVHYLTVRDLLQNKIERELQLTTSSIANSIHTTANTTIRNYLRAISETNLIYVQTQYQRFKAGEITESEAKKNVSQMFIQQRIGESGYPYVVNSEGVIQIHPKTALIDQNLMEFSFMQQQVKTKKGYLEYDWKNPGESKERPKALHMIYFQPWDWIISSSSYRSEFLSLINITDFQTYISSQKFGETGYSYVINSLGDVVLHPFISGNFLDVKDSNGFTFVKAILEQKNGAITYTWRNPNEGSYREKYAIFQYIPDYDWYVVSATYSEELFRPVEELSQIYLVILFVSVAVLIPSNLLLSRSIVIPLKQVMESLKTAGTGRYDTRMEEREECNDELNELSHYFNRFMHELEQSNKELHLQIEQKIQAQQQQMDLNRQLEDLNQSLENKVVERTHDLQVSMAQLQETQEQLVESEKLAALGGLVAGVAHEVNTPLGISVTATSLIGEIVDELNTAFTNQTLTSSQYSELMGRLGETRSMLQSNLARAAQLIKDFKQTAVDQVSENQSEFLIEDVLKALVSSLHSETAKIPVTPLLTVEGKLVMNSLPGVLTQVVSNLIMNSVNHGFPQAHLDYLQKENITPNISLVITQASDVVTFRYQDNGIGVDASLHQKIFEPFYTSKRGQGGSGLGLNLVFNMVNQKLGGKLQFSSIPNQGVEFTLELPVNLPES